MTVELFIDDYGFGWRALSQGKVLHTEQGLDSSFDAVAESAWWLTQHGVDNVLDERTEGGGTDD